MEFQEVPVLDYKHRSNGFDVVYINPYRTSSTCTRCGGWIAPMERKTNMLKM